MKRLACKQCTRVVEIEATYRTESATGEPVFVKQAHSRTKGEELQCACGGSLS
jgi:hypothetical protein